MSLKRPNPAAHDRSISPPAAKRKVTTSTTNKTVANFFKPTSQKEPEKVSFSTIKNSLFTARYQDAQTRAWKRPVKIAAFDFDDTLITTKSGLKFARGEDDWKWWHVSVPGRLKQLDAEGYAIVIISNQGAIALSTANSKAPKLDMKSLGTFKGKVLAVLNALELPISVYAATERDLFRKPRTGMWDQLLQDYGLSDIAGDIDRENSIFVGDAAGRAEDKAIKARKDHACSDRDFAANVGIKFNTPEEFFLNESPRTFVRAFEPAQYLETTNANDITTSPTSFQKKHTIELVLFCGSPGAGKSTFYWTHLKPLGYERVNQDILKTRDRCMKAATQYLDDKTSVVVDNTNADIETRASWIALAYKSKVPIRLVHFTASAKLCEHNDTVRALTGVSMNPEGRTMLPKMAFHGYASRYREPRVEEGFEDIIKVDFQFIGTDEQRKLWQKYWIS